MQDEDTPSQKKFFTSFRTSMTSLLSRLTGATRSSQVDDMNAREQESDETLVPDGVYPPNRGSVLSAMSSPTVHRGSIHDLAEGRGSRKTFDMIKRRSASTDDVMRQLRSTMGTMNSDDYEKLHTLTACMSPDEQTEFVRKLDKDWRSDKTRKHWKKALHTAMFLAAKQGNNMSSVVPPTFARTGGSRRSLEMELSKDDKGLRTKKAKKAEAKAKLARDRSARINKLVTKRGSAASGRSLLSLTVSNFSRRGSTMSNTNDGWYLNPNFEADISGLKWFEIVRVPEKGDNWGWAKVRKFVWKACFVQMLQREVRMYGGIVAQHRGVYQVKAARHFVPRPSLIFGDDDRDTKSKGSSSWMKIFNGSSHRGSDASKSRQSTGSQASGMGILKRQNSKRYSRQSTDMALGLWELPHDCCGFPLIMDPLGSAVLSWEFFIMAVSIFMFFYIPIAVAFSSWSSCEDFNVDKLWSPDDTCIRSFTLWRAIDVFLDLTQVLDIWLNRRVSYQTGDDRFELDPVNVRSTYMKKYFWRDAFLAIPFSLIGLPMPLQMSGAVFVYLMTFTKMFRVLRVERSLARLSKLKRVTDMVHSVTYSAWRPVANFLLMLVAPLHLCSCLLIFTVEYEARCGDIGVTHFRDQVDLDESIKLDDVGLCYEKIFGLPVTCGLRNGWASQFPKFATEFCWEEVRGLQNSFGVCMRGNAIERGECRQRGDPNGCTSGETCWVVDQYSPYVWDGIDFADAAHCVQYENRAACEELDHVGRVAKEDVIWKDVDGNYGVNTAPSDVTTDRAWPISEGIPVLVGGAKEPRLAIGIAEGGSTVMLEMLGVCYQLDATAGWVEISRNLEGRRIDQSECESPENVGHGYQWRRPCAWKSVKAPRQKWIRNDQCATKINGLCEDWRAGEEVVEWDEEEDRVLQCKWKTYRTSNYYVVAIYFVVETMFTLGLGDFTPTSNKEMGFVILTVIMGVAVLSYLTATLTALINRCERNAERTRDRMFQLDRFVRMYGIKDTVAMKLIEFMKYDYESQNAEEEAQKVMATLPEALKGEVVFYVYPGVQDSAVMKLLTPEFAKMVVSKMKKVFVREGQVFCRANDFVKGWCIIISGCLVSTSSCGEIIYMSFVPGASFGEIGVFITDRCRMNLKAIANTELLLCNTRDYMALLMQYTDDRRTMQELAERRYQKLKRSIKRARRLWEDSSGKTTATATAARSARNEAVGTSASKTPRTNVSLHSARETPSPTRKTHGTRGTLLSHYTSHGSSSGRRHSLDSRSMQSFERTPEKVQASPANRKTRKNIAKMDEAMMLHSPDQPSVFQHMMAAEEAAGSRVRRGSAGEEDELQEIRKQRFIKDLEELNPVPACLDRSPDSKDRLQVGRISHTGSEIENSISGLQMATNVDSSPSSAVGTGHSRASLSPTLMHSNRTSLTDAAYGRASHLPEGDLPLQCGPQPPPRTASNASAATHVTATRRPKPPQNARLSQPDSVTGRLSKAEIANARRQMKQHLGNLNSSLHSPKASFAAARHRRSFATRAHDLSIALGGSPVNRNANELQKSRPRRDSLSILMKRTQQEMDGQTRHSSRRGSAISMSHGRPEDSLLIGGPGCRSDTGSPLSEDSQSSGASLSAYPDKENLA